MIAINSTCDIRAKIASILPTLQGWCSLEKANHLAETILSEKPLICVELGVYGGSSFVPIALAVQENNNGGIAYGIDPWTTRDCLEGMVEPANKQWWGNLNIEAIYQGCQRAIGELGLNECCHLIRAKSEDAASRFVDGSIGLLHIDGNHSEEISHRDSVLWLPKMLSVSTIYVDDFRWFENGVFTTQKAIEHIKSNGFEEVGQVNDCLILHRS